MLHSHSARNSFVRFKSNHASKQIKSVFIEVLGVLRKRNALPFGESGLEIWEFKGSSPIGFVWCTLNLENLEYLINFGITCEEGFSLSHFSKDATD
jgi:hypothetical protein